jgi:GWxTD domain-containing protein
MSQCRISLILLFLMAGVGATSNLYAQPPAKSHDQQSQSAQDSAKDQKNSQSQDDQNPLKRKRPAWLVRKQEKAYRNELKGPYKKWLNQTVRWIITDKERRAFLSLTNDEERDAFIENFWRRRNPNPDSPYNSYREEIYRRIAYANQHFSDGEPGWMTDRGMIYIKYGPPTSIDSHPSGGMYNRPISEGGGQTSTYPFSDWHYRYIPGIGENVNIEFVDQCMCGNYQMTIDRSAKDALLHVPGAGETLYEQMGMAKKKDRFNGGLEDIGPGPDSAQNQSKEFDRLEQFAKLEAPPEIKFKDLENFVTSHKLLTGPFFPFDVQTDYVKIGQNTVLVPITLQIKQKDITFKTKDGVSKGVVDIYGRVTTITDQVVTSFEDTVEVEQPAELLSQTADHASLYWKALPLKPGRYRIDLAIKDVNNPNHVGTWAQAITVPQYNDNSLATSSLILASKMERVPDKNIGTGRFTLGDTLLWPRVMESAATPASFKRNQNLNFWMQVYNLGVNEKTKRNDATIEYQIINDKDHKTLLDTTEKSTSIAADADQLTIEKKLPLGSLQPGKYTVKIKIHDAISGQNIAQSAPFVVD